MMTLAREIGLLVRVHREQPWHALAVIGILAVAIGVNTAVFSVFNAVLLLPLPYAHAERLVRIFDVHAGTGVDRIGPSPGNFLDWERAATSFSAMAAWYAGKPRTLEGDDAAAKIPVADVTTAFFDVFDAEPALGRVFRAGDDAPAQPVAVMSHGLWLERFGGDSSIVGRTVLLNGERHIVVAVMPANFHVPAGDVGFWLPWDLRASYARLPEVPRDFRFLEVAGRLRPGVTMAHASSEMARLTATLATAHPAQNVGWSVRLVGFGDEVVGRFGQAVTALLFAVALVLLIACTNVANLTLARMFARTRELAVRAALGASEARLLRAVFLESLCLALVGGAGGVLLAVAGVRTLVMLAPPALPRVAEISIDSGVLLFSLGVAAMSGLLIGLAPAVRMRGLVLADVLRGGDRSGTMRGQARARQALVAAQVALAFGLVAGATLMTRSLLKIVNVDPGFDARGVLVVRAFPDEERFDGEERLRYFDQLYGAIRALPGVTAVGATTGLPMNRFNNAPDRPFWADDVGRPEGGPPSAPLMMTSLGYFTTMRIPLIDGRDFGVDDRAGAPPVAIVSAGVARRLWGDVRAAGKRLTIDFASRGTTSHEVIGVVGDVRGAGPSAEPEPGIYLPHAQVPYAQMNVVVRTTVDPITLATAVRREVLRIDPRQPVHSITTLERLLGETIAEDRFATFMAGLLSAVALLLSMSGTYAVAAQVVSERKREIGIRSALGASRRQIGLLIAGQVGAMLSLGAGAGVLLSLAVMSALRDVSSSASEFDPVTLAATTIVLALSALVAIVGPLRRALRVAPTEAMRRE